MQPLPHMHVLQNQDFSSSLVSNIANLGNYKTFLLQILIIFHDMTIVSTEEVISYNFLILVTSKPRFFKFTTSNTELEELQNLSLTDIDYFS